MDTTNNVVFGDDELNMDAFHNSFIIDEQSKVRSVEKKKNEEKPPEEQVEQKLIFNGVEMSEAEAELMIFLSEKQNPFSTS
jgi:hypothetical protein